ncbi:SU10 major capsid protein [Dethiothermospora halolimnae]|uniref:SU10 major capsid protein n=1 Tax=Dethiothermospora halolimnae TaxID=3114390 RepID=UPI003CCBA926
MSIFDKDLIGKKQSVVDEILLLNSMQTPLISLIGFSKEVNSTKHEWFEDEMYATESTATAAKTDADTEIVVADIEPFRINHVIRCGEELMLITGINSGSRELTVVRGYASTDTTPIDSGSKIEVLFVEGEEGADARKARYKARTANQNYTQIFDDTIKISGTAEAVAQHGIADIYEYEKQKKQVELALQLEKAAINGVKYNNGTKRMMGGIRSFIKTNVIDAGDSEITIDMINDLAQKIYTYGGFKSGGRYVIMVPAVQKRKISKLKDDKIIIERKDQSRGQVVNSILTDFGEFDILLNNNLHADELLIDDINRIKLMPLQGREFFHKYLGEKGDYTEGQIVGEYTLEFQQEKAHARINGLKTV